MSIQRILALFFRHAYLLKRSFPRLLEIFYWPLVDLLVWGFLTVYLGQYRESLPQFITFFIGALIFWDILFRAHSGIAVSFLEDLWSKNLLNLFTSPLLGAEYIISLMLVSTAKLMITTVVLAFLAWVLYSFNILVIGFSLLPFVINLIIMGWVIGIVTVALILRFGQEAEVLAWALGFLFMPLSAVFYPVSVLPPFLQAVAQFIPSAHVFEGMRAVLQTGQIPVSHLLWATGLNAAALTSVFFFFSWSFSYIKKRGLLVRIGE
mgnify:CR=1 FL=1